MTDVPDRRTSTDAIVPQELRSWIGQVVSVKGKGGTFKQEKVTMQTVIVYLGLAWHANKESGLCCPAQKKIASDLKMSKTTVGRGIRILQALGAVGVKQLENEHGYVYNEYSLIDIPPAASISPAPPVPLRPDPVPVGTEPGTATGFQKPHGYLNSNPKTKKRVREEENAAAEPPPPPPASASEDPKPVADDLQLLAHIDAEFKKASGLDAIRIGKEWGRDRVIAQNILKHCPDGLDEAKQAATIYARESVAADKPVVLKWILSGIAELRQKVHKGKPFRRSSNVVVEHPMSKMDRVEKEWRAAHPGQEPQGRDQMSGWARSAGRMNLRKQAMTGNGAAPKAPPV